MRVSPNNPQIQSGETHGTRQAHEKQDSKAGHKAHNYVHHVSRAEISERAREMLAAKAAAAGAPDVREDRIAELKNRIASGSYKVDAQAVADRLVNDHLKMSGLG